MYYMMRVMDVDQNYEGVINLELLSSTLKKRLIDSVEYGLKNGRNYGEILNASKEEMNEILEQKFMSSVNFPYHIDAIVEMELEDTII